VPTAPSQAAGTTQGRIYRLPAEPCNDCKVTPRKARVPVNGLLRIQAGSVGVIIIGRIKRWISGARLVITGAAGLVTEAISGSPPGVPKRRCCEQSEISWRQMR